MQRALRIVGYALIGVTALLGVVIVAFLLLTRTEAGLRQIHGFVLGQIQDRVEGDVRIDRITTRRILEGATFHDVAIIDRRGRPFLLADSVELRYSWRTLLAGDLVFHDVVAHRPEVYFEHLPADTVWNIELLFPPPVVPPERRLIRIDDARIIDGLVTVRTPWRPEPPVAPEDTARLILREAPGGLVRELRFEAVHATLPSVLWESPVEEGQVYQVASLATVGFIWEDPFDLRDLHGVVTRQDSILAFDVPGFRLPASRGAGFGRIELHEDRAWLDIHIDGPEFALRDLEWLHPPLSVDGGGRMTFRIQSQDPGNTLWYASDAHIRAPGTEVAGDFGVVTGDSLYFTRVSLRASPLDLELIERILPLDLPVEGLLIGTVVLEGPLSSLVTSGDVQLARRGEPNARSGLRWRGTFDARAPYGVQSLEAELTRVDLGLASSIWPDVQGEGSITGRVEASGRFDRVMRFAGSLEHHLDGVEPSRVDARGSLTRLPGGPSLEAELRAHPLSLDALATAVPGLGALRGEIHGPISIQGPLPAVLVDADLETAAGGLLLRGRVGLDRADPHYSLAGRVAEFRLHELLDGLPPTSLTGSFELVGEGTGVARTRATLSAELEAGEVAGVRLRDGAVAVRIEDGLARVDSLVLSGDAGRLAGRGSFGLVPERTGQLTLALQSDSLAVLRPAIFPDTALLWDPTGSLASLDGRATVRAELTGNLSSWDARGDATVEDMVVDRVQARRARLGFSVTTAETGPPRLRLNAHADSLDLYGRLINAARLDLAFDPASGAGSVAFGADAPDAQRYGLGGAFRLDGRTADVELGELYLRTGPSAWSLAEPGRFRVGPAGLDLESLRLERADGAGHLVASGRLPWLDEAGGRAPADFRVEFDQLRLGELARVAWPGTELSGLLGGRLEFSGDARSPRLRGQVDAGGLRVGDAAVDRFEGTFAYGDRRLDGSATAVHDGRTVLHASGTLPLDLTLGSVERRWLARPVDVSIRLDDFPVALPVISLLDGFHDVRGGVSGTLVLENAGEEPALTGVLALRDAAASWATAGVRYRDVEGEFRLLGDRVVEVDVRGRTGDGLGQVTGTVAFRQPRDPELDLRLAARELEAVRRPELQLAASGEARLRGRYREPVVSGRLTLDRGVLNADELVRRQRIVELESPLLFELIDTTDVSATREIRSLENPFVRNLVVENATVRAVRDVWLRGRDMNVEGSGELTVQYDRRSNDLRLFGVLTAIRGHYLLYGRRFHVRQGTVEFVGAPGINPQLDILAVYRARTEGEPLDIRAGVTGTLRHPRVELSSDIEPPLSESDLASYLIFGRPTYALAPGESRALAAGVRLGVDVVGTSFLGFALSGLETMAAEGLGLDYLAITPADVSAAGVETSPFEDLVAGSQIEVGRYLADNLFVAYTQRLGISSSDVRLEWRFHPTWTVELFAEDRFARTPTFGRLQPLDFNKVYGFFLFREWGY